MRWCRLIDAKYRTLARRESRAVVGDFFGGRGALKLAMVKADVFSVAYAMHPVATGTGDIPWSSLEIDWPRMHAAKTFGELGGLGRTQIFWAIHQAFAPNVAAAALLLRFLHGDEGREGRRTTRIARWRCRSRSC